MVGALEGVVQEAAQQGRKQRGVRGVRGGTLRPSINENEAGCGLRTAHHGSELQDKHAPPQAASGSY